MPESTEVVLARIDERTKMMHVDIKDIKAENDKQDTAIRALQMWRSGLAGAFGLGAFLFGLFLKFGG